MTTINQMIASTEAVSCLVPFEYNHYGSGRFQSWFAENERLSGNPCKAMDAFQTGLQRLAMEFSCLDGIPGNFFEYFFGKRSFRKTKRQMGRQNGSINRSSLLILTSE